MNNDQMGSSSEPEVDHKEERASSRWVGSWLRWVLAVIVLGIVFFSGVLWGLSIRGGYQAAGERFYPMMMRDRGGWDREPYWRR